MAVYTLSEYPKQLEAADDSVIIIEPLRPENRDALLEFFLRVPEDDRYYLKEDVTSPKVVGEWIDNMDYSRALPLIAQEDGRIVADGTLHRRRAGARSHLAEIRIVVDPDYRNKGVGRALMRELISIAEDSGLEKVIFELVADEQDDAKAAASALGFVQLSVVPNHIKDVRGRLHDLLIMELPLGKWRQWWNY
ncbi:MAG: GNAT family N-acetyltransferase [SAR202 cluster bacterium]|jgi:L-amino acid N-acyltransferase YncA|nr:GNAT family N-acetyltransferase [SAR202 cluster bacterium]MDP6512468.1 GNAT family N-acetyltransferase [SAR202 cluster bacterium]MDP6716533.1 GNAT family N-acetyltransferase [SAR202 cluster bacterium]